MKKILLVLTFTITFNNYSQNTDTEYALYNIISGSIVGGVGAVINKNPQQKFWKTFLRGSSQGAVGGYLVFESKRLVREFTRKEDYTYIWPSRLLNSAGNSIIMNGAYNNVFGQHWHFNLGFINITHNSKLENNFRIRILPASFVSAGIGFITGKFDSKKSLKTGTLIFNTSKRYNDAFGVTLMNSIYHWNEAPERFNFQIIGHELLHTYQYEGTFSLNSYLDRPNKLLQSVDSDIIELYHKIFFSDFNSFYMMGTVVIQDLMKIPDFDRPTEKEPYYFTEYLID